MFEMYKTHAEVCGLLCSANKLNVMDEAGVLISCEDVCLALEDINRMDFFVQVDTLRNTIPENCTSLNTLECSKNLSEIYPNGFVELKILLLLLTIDSSNSGETPTTSPVDCSVPQENNHILDNTYKNSIQNNIHNVE
jgi:hypothetical protein